MSGFKLYIGGLNRSLSTSDLKNYFSRFGHVVDLYVCRERIFGFVIFADCDVALRVLNDTHIIKGRSVTVEISNSTDSGRNHDRRRTRRLISNRHSTREAMELKLKQEMIENERLRKELENMKKSTSQTKPMQNKTDEMSAKHWYIYDKNKKTGPLKDRDVIDMYSKQAINEQTLIYHHRVSSEWSEIVHVPYIYDKIEKMRIVKPTIPTPPVAAHIPAPTLRYVSSNIIPIVQCDSMISNTNLYLEGLPREWTSFDLRKFISRLQIKPTSVRILPNRNIGFLEFEHPQEANQALRKCKNTKALPFRIKFANKRKRSRGISNAKKKRKLTTLLSTNNTESNNDSNPTKKRRLSTVSSTNVTMNEAPQHHAPFVVANNSNAVISIDMQRNEAPQMTQNEILSAFDEDYPTNSQPKSDELQWKLKKYQQKYERVAGIARRLFREAITADEPKWNLVQLETDERGVQRDTKLQKIRIQITSFFPPNTYTVCALDEWRGCKQIEKQIQNYLKINGEYAMNPKILIYAKPVPVHQLLQKIKFGTHPRISALSNQFGVVAAREIPKFTVLGQYSGAELSTQAWNDIFSTSSSQFDHNLKSFDQKIDPQILKQLNINQEVSFVVDPLIGKWNEFLLQYVNDCRKCIEHKEPTEDDHKYFNVDFVSVAVDGWTQTYLISKRVIHKGEEIMSYYGSTYSQAMQEKMRNDQIRKKRQLKSEFNFGFAEHQIDDFDDEETESEQEIEVIRPQSGYVVDKIINHRQIGNKYEFYVKWMGFGDRAPTWEPSNVLNRSDIDRYFINKGLIFNPQDKDKKEIIVIS